jgi:ribosomal protein L13E
LDSIKPLVFKRDGRKRYGKGFSREELKKAGSNLGEASKLGIPADFRRRTFLKENVNVIKKFLKTKKKIPNSRKKRTSKAKT